MRIAFQKWPVSGQRVWTFTNHQGQLFLLAPFGPLATWNVYGFPHKMDPEGWEFPSRRQAVKFISTLLKERK